MVAKKKKQSKLNGLFPMNKQEMQEVIDRFESELGRAVDSVKDKGQKSKDLVMKNIDQLIDNLGALDLKNKAIEKTNEFVENLKDLNLNFNQAKFEDLTEKISVAMSNVQDLEVVEYAKGKMTDTKNHLFSMLNIPSKVDVDHLSRKVVSLEKKVKSISRHART